MAPGEVCRMRARKSPTQLSWASDPARDVRVTTVGTRRALLENHRGLAEYTAEHVRARCQKGSVCVRGRALSLREVRKDALIISGAIDAVEFCHDTPAD